MSVILDITSTPQSFTTGNWPITHFNGGVLRWSITYTNASAAYSSYHSMFVQATGGCWIIGGAWELYDTSDNLCFSRAHTWSAGQTVTYILDTTAKTYSISGATTGNITNQAWTESGPYWAAGTLYTAEYPGGLYSIDGTISDVDDMDDSLDAVLAATLGSLTSAATAVAALTATASPTLGNVVPTATAVVPLVATAAQTLGDATLASTATAGGDPSAVLDATLGDMTSAATATAALAATAAPTLGNVVPSATAAVALAAAASPTLGNVTLSAHLGGAVSLGVHASQSLEYGAANTGEVETTPAVTTQVSGSSFLLSVGRHTGLGTPTGELAGSSDGNTYTQHGVDFVFGDFPDYETALYIAQEGTGGANHRWQQGGVANFDEAAIMAVEIIGGHHIQDAQESEESAASTITSPSVTTTAEAILVSFLWGTGADTAEDMSATVSDGWEIIEAEVRMFGGNGAFSCWAAWKYAGTLGVQTGCPWQARMGVGQATAQGGQLYTVAVQAEEVILEAQLGATLGNVASSAAAAVALKASAAPTLADMTSAATASGVLSASTSATLGDATIAATAVVAIVAQAAATLGALTSAATAAAALTAALGGTLGDVTSSATAQAALTVQTDATLGSLTSAAAAVVALQASLGVTLGDLTSSGEATTADAIATLDATLGSLTSEATATVLTHAALTATLGELTSAAQAAATLAAQLTRTLGTMTTLATADVEGDAPELPVRDPRARAVVEVSRVRALVEVSRVRAVIELEEGD